MAGIESVIVQPPPLCKGAGEISGEFIEEMAGFLYNYRQAYERIALSYQLKLLDLYTPMLDRATGWGSTDCYIDEAHPSRKGYQVMAAVAADFFKKL